MTNTDYEKKIAATPFDETGTEMNGDRHSASRKMSELRGQAEHVVASARTGAADALATGERYMRENPFGAILAALLGGFLLGLAVGPRRKTFSERYIEEPADHAHGAMVAAALALAAASKRILRSGSRQASSAASSVRSYSKPVRKAAHDVGKKLHVI